MYQRNLAVAKKHNPAMYNLLKAGYPKIKGVFYKQSKSGHSVLVVERDSPIVLEDVEDPMKAAELTANSIKDTVRLVVVKGTGTGYILRALLRRKTIETIVVIEPQFPLFTYALSQEYFGDILKSRRVRFIFDKNPASSDNALKRLYDYGTEEGRMLIMFPEMVMLSHPVMCLSGDFNKTFMESFTKSKVTSDRNRLTISTFMHTWRENILGNIPHMLRAVPSKELTGTCEGGAGVLVSAGPSLNRNKDLLREVQGKIPIVCVDTAYRALKNSGIDPDLVVAVDGSNANAAYFDGVEVGEGTALVMVPVVQPKIPAKFQKVYVTSYGHPLQVWVESLLGQKFGSLLISGSVSTLAFDLMRQMGMKKIIMVGQDLAYSSEGTHVRGAKTFNLPHNKYNSFETDIYQATAPANKEVPAWGGRGVVRSTDQMIRWRQWFEQQIKLSPDVEVINATEGGSRIEGTVEIPLGEALRGVGDAVTPELWTEQVGNAPERFQAKVKENFDTKGRKDNIMNKVLSWERALMPVEEFEVLRSRLGDRIKEMVGC